jgi:PAS domain S-box-containing protein
VGRSASGRPDRKAPRSARPKAAHGSGARARAGADRAPAAAVPSAAEIAARRERQFEVFFEVASTIQETTDLDVQLNRIAEGIVKAQTFRRAVISLLDKDWKVVKVGHAGLSDAEVARVGKSAPLSPEDRRRVLQERYRISSSYYIPHDDPLARGVLRGVPSSRKRGEFVDWHPADLLFVPLLGRAGGVIGTLSVDDPFDGRRPTAESLRIIELFAKEAASTIELGNLYREIDTAEKYLKDLVEHSSDAIITSDFDGRIVIYNTGAERMIGFTRDEAVRMQVTDFYETPEAARVVMRELRGGRFGGVGRLQNYEVNLRARDGELIPVSLTASILHDASGREIGTAGISKDLREIKRLQKELVEREKMSTIGEIGALLCHEINNFLESILTAGELSQSFFKNEQIRRLFIDAGLGEEMEREIERLGVVHAEAMRIAGITERVQLLASQKSYSTTEYVDDVQMVDLEESTRAATPRKGARILVADDRVHIRTFLKEYLTLEGYDVDVAEDGTDALAKATATEYDVVLSDIKMPGLNGYEVFTAVRRLGKGTQVILMTAYGYDPTHSVVKSVADGLSEVLYKPFDLQRLGRAIEKALAARAAAREG